MTHKHTPAPYQQHALAKSHLKSDPIGDLFNGEGIVYITQISGAQKQIGAIVQRGNREWNEADKTARVMLAAPELLEALKELCSHYIDNPILPEHYDDPQAFADAILKRNEKLDKADAAIAKARGQS